MDEETRAQAAQNGDGSQEPPINDPETDTGNGNDNTNGADSRASGTTELSTLPDDVRKLIGDLRKENAKHRKAAKQAEEKAKADETARMRDQQQWKELAERLEKENADLQTQIDDLNTNALRAKVAEKVGLPQKFANRIMGATEEEMTEDAKALLDAMPKPQVGPTHNDARFGLGGGNAQTLTTDQVAERKRRAGSYQL